jgi:hypothetical protein
MRGGGGQARVERAREGEEGEEKEESGEGVEREEGEECEEGGKGEEGEEDCQSMCTKEKGAMKDRRPGGQGGGGRWGDGGIARRVGSGSMSCWGRGWWW